MILRPPRSTRPDTLFPYTPLFRSRAVNSGPSQDALFSALCRILPLSALLARRLPIRQVAKMAIAWIAIFALALLLATQRHRVAAAWSSLPEAAFGNRLRVSGRTTRLPMTEAGHSSAPVSNPGAPRRQLPEIGREERHARGAM